MRVRGADASVARADNHRHMWTRRQVLQALDGCIGRGGCTKALLPTLHAHHSDRVRAGPSLYVPAPH